MSAEVKGGHLALLLHTGLISQPGSVVINWLCASCGLSSSAGFSNLVLPRLSQNGIQRKKKKGKGGKKEKKACVVYQILASPLAGSEMKGPLSCRARSCLPWGGLFFSKCPNSFMMTPPFIMNSCCFGPKLSLFFLSSLPFKFGFKCAHMHPHTHLLLGTTAKPRRAGGGRGAGKGRWERAAGCVLCELLCTCSL